VRALYVTDPVDCQTFRRYAHAFLDEELARDDRRKLQGHLDLCQACAATLEIEASFGRGLRARLTRVPAPEGLEGKIRARLAAEPAVPAERPSGAPRGTVAAALLAASVVVALLTVPALLRSGSIAPVERAGMERVVREATVVDLVCDEGGLGIDAQRACRAPGHINALKLAGGAYWGILEDGAQSRALANSPENRGRKVTVEGTYYPAIQSIAISSIRDVAAAGLHHTEDAVPSRSTRGDFPGIDWLATLLMLRPGRYHPARGDA
jgi:anti-sigma factor (TIGR02949 family)